MTPLIFLGYKTKSNPIFLYDFSIFSKSSSTIEMESFFRIEFSFRWRKSFLDFLKSPSLLSCETNARPIPACSFG